MERRERGKCTICGWPMDHHRKFCPMMVADGPERTEAEAAWEAGKVAAETGHSEEAVEAKLENPHFAEAYRIFSLNHPIKNL